MEGEITNASSSARGHLYFTLKDEAAAVDCVMWSSRARRLPFSADDGLAVLAFGSLTVYPQRGRLQMVVEDLQPKGIGALQLAFEQLKERLTKEGLFAADRKKPLPDLPNRVGVVTSGTGAALHDMLKVLARFPHLEVVVAPTRVQGDGAADEIAVAISRLAASGLVNTLIVGRGGGSLEDLWAFNEEAVARAIANCPLPVISGVGHEVDFTIADFVADVRATTPTQAAEIVVAKLESQQRRLDQAGAALVRDLKRHHHQARTRLEGLEGSSGLSRLPQRLRWLRSRLDRSDRLPGLLRALSEKARARLDHARDLLSRVPARVAAGGQRQLVASHARHLEQLLRARVRRMNDKIDAHERALSHLSPSRVLARGYSITSLEGSTVPLKSATRVRPGQVLTTTLSSGSLRSLVARPSSSGGRSKPAADEQPSLFDDPADPPTPTGSKEP